jgi:hypothetical protein
VSKDATAWFIQNKLAKLVISCDKARLLVQSLTWWWVYATNNYVSDFTFGMATDNMNCFDGSHGIKFRVTKP